MGPPAFLTSPMLNLGVMLGSMQLVKKIPFEDPQILMYARYAYYGMNLLVILWAFYLKTAVAKKNDRTPLNYTAPPKASFGAQATATEETITTTNSDYDQAELQKFITTSLTSLAVISVLHWKFGVNQPLLVQSIMPLKNFLIAKPVIIHLWGDAAEGDLKRPWKADANPLAALMGGGSTSTTEEEHEKKE
ncbi:inorganic phosphate transporter [Umbelopsis sp. PMI_123]|nr:inorganic phosphate transporter [Umbelopsis sp. PMI_123]